MKRQRMLMPGAFKELDLTEGQQDEKIQFQRKSELCDSLLGIAAGLTLAALLATGLYHGHNDSPKIMEAKVAFRNR